MALQETLSVLWQHLGSLRVADAFLRFWLLATWIKLCFRVDRRAQVVLSIHIVYGVTCGPPLYWVKCAFECGDANVRLLCASGLEKHKHGEEVLAGEPYCLSRTASNCASLVLDVNGFVCFRG